MLMSARLHGDEKGQASRVPQHRPRNFTPDIWPFAFTEMLKITLKVLYLLHRLMVPSSPGRCGKGGGTFVIIAFAGIRVYIYFLTNHGMRCKTHWLFYFRF